MALLDKHSTVEPESWDKKKIEKKTKSLLAEIYEYSKRLHAEGKQSLLIVLQGMDASGKDGLTRTLFQELSPAWTCVHSFKKPTPEEYAHDFLWRIHQRCPEHGIITVFNRSHYEDILVPSVYGYLDEATIEKRYQQVNDFEKLLQDGGTTILKFFLNVSHEKQEVKLMERVNTLEKHWKHSDGDWQTREKWNEFRAVYEKLFERCNDIPWHIIPCDKNWVKTHCAAEIVVDTLKKMDPQYPQLDSALFSPDYSKRKMNY